MWGIWGYSKCTMRWYTEPADNEGTQEGATVRRVLTTVTAAVMAVFWLALPAIAQQYPPYPPQPGGDPGTTGGSAAGGGDLAFTGTNVTVWLVVAALAIVVGAVIVVLARRPATVEAE